MESVGTPDPHSWEYDPDDVGISISSGHTSGRDAVAMAAIGPGGSSLIQRDRISAISDLKELIGKDMDKDRARAWIGKVKLAYQRDQATEEEKCLTFADLMVGPAKNWHRQLSRTTKTKWADLLDSLQTQYCGLGIGMAVLPRPKRSEETPLDYLYRLNVAALRAKLKMKDGNLVARRERVDHYIETLDDPRLADRLTLLRLADVDELEEVIRARERAKNRQRRSAFGSKYRQKAPASAPAAPARSMVRAIQAQDPSSGSEGVSGSDGSDSEVELPGRDRREIQHNPGRKRHREAGSLNVAPRETGITKTETAVRIVGPGNTRRIAVCMRVVDVGTSTRQENAPWRDSTIRSANGRSPGWNPVRADRSKYCIYACVNKAMTDQDRKKSDLRGNTCNLHSYTAKIASIPRISEYSRSEAEVALDLKRGESRGIGNVMHRENGSDKLRSQAGSIKRERSCS
ncbi:LOW QUALITY PROTEIN: hypothetical protein PHMEG_00020440 [Phytophthora megakarya]|uniref:Eukaryotic/viral aspartic protease n=1 Tax=Phytophthora megakarya TaxID=4795 RepID=A0A225VQ89_9STRA|nr:LOW QUALITY PROTEIN: hypothetical protein PHMEG_00020440 [Phytophthora megakarya]